MTSYAEETSFEEAYLRPQNFQVPNNSITAVIPAYDEERTIEAVVRTAARYVSEVIVVDDGSKDRTGKLAVTAGATVIRIPNNSGKGHALGIGLSTAAMNGCRVVVCLDADGQHDPTDIPKLTQPIIDGEADMVIGSRFMNSESRKMIPRYRKVGQNILTTATNLGNSVKITDSQSGYRAFNKNILARFAFLESGMGIESEMIRSAVRSGARIKEVSIAARYHGLETSTHHPGSHGMRVLGSIIRSVRSEHPLLCFGLAGLSAVILGAVFGMFSLDHYMSSGSLPFGPTLLSATLILIGTILMLVGLILNAISSMSFPYRTL